MLAAGLEPTNNHSEQQIRHVVIDRRITQGTRSESGQRYHETQKKGQEPNWQFGEDSKLPNFPID